MRFVIATLPDTKFQLGRELSLVKTSVLYGDSAVLFSPPYGHYDQFVDFENRTVLYQLDKIATLAADPFFTIGEDLSVEDMENRIRDARAESRRLFKLADRVTKLLDDEITPQKWIEIQAELGRIREAIQPRIDHIVKVNSEVEDQFARFRALRRAEELGFLEIAAIEKRRGIYYSPERVQDDVVSLLSRPDTYPALDERLVLRQPLPSGDEAAHKLRATRVAEALFDRLPTFEAASLDEIIDIRRELSTGIQAFRAAVVSIAGDIRSMPWSREFPHEVERELQTRVLPGIEEIEQGLRANSYMRELAGRLATNPLALPAGSGIGLLLASAAEGSTLLGQVAGAIAAGGVQAYSAYTAHRSARRAVEGNEFWFYYQAKKKLS